MNNRRNNCFRLVFISMLVCLAAGAQERRVTQNAQGVQQRDPLASLKQVLSNIGASALDSSQQTALNTLITKFQSSNRSVTLDPDYKTALEAYANAIFAKDLGAATKAADILANITSARQRKAIERQAGFTIQALSCLHRDQLAALQTRMGKIGTVAVLQVLTLSALSRGITTGGSGAEILGASPQVQPGNAK
jgi:hypothetical protein